MPLHCIEARRSPVEEEDETSTCIWDDTPESVLLYIFSYLTAGQLLCVAQTCKVWHRVAFDESLWRDLVRKHWGIKDTHLAPGKYSWMLEYKRLHYHCPIVLSETLTEHNDEVLHVSFSHDGSMFSTTSKDATIKVWEVGYPTQMKFNQDFRTLLSWDFTQFSCFNQSDTMLLVSSVKTADFMDRRGYVAILSLIHDFHILRLVSMDPSQLFGAWLDDRTFLGGYLEITLDRFATTVQIESFQVDKDLILPMDSPPVIEDGEGKNLFTFSSETASLIKFLTVANVPARNSINEEKEVDQHKESMEDSDTESNCAGLNKNMDENQNSNACNSALGCRGQDTATGDTNIRNLVFVTGEFAVALHQLGFKNVSSVVMQEQSPFESNDVEVAEEMDFNEAAQESHMVVNFTNNDIRMREVRKSDKPDHVIDLYGHVTGLCLSDDHRYLFLNCRPWIGKVDRTDPWATPDLSPSIEIRVIDLWTLEDLEARYLGHKGYSPSTMCCFVFLDISKDYVGSGSEDARGYLWDKHYRCNLATFQHSWGVVNAVGFNPLNQEYLVTVSDDNTIKVWRSRSEMKALHVQTENQDDSPQEHVKSAKGNT